MQAGHSPSNGVAAQALADSPQRARELGGDQCNTPYNTRCSRLNRPCRGRLIGWGSSRTSHSSCPRLFLARPKASDCCEVNRRSHVAKFWKMQSRGQNLDQRPHSYQCGRDLVLQHRAQTPAAILTFLGKIPIALCCWWQPYFCDRSGSKLLWSRILSQNLESKCLSGCVLVASFECFRVLVLADVFMLLIACLTTRN